MVSSIGKEIALKRKWLADETIDTIYFGGGTPSILDPEMVEKILEKVFTVYSIAADPEITFEANPEHCSIQYLHALKEMGVNRLSIGLQSFSNRTLKWFNRGHDSEKGKRAVEIIRESGIENYNLDLIFGASEQSQEEFKNDLSIFSDFSAPHISAYALTIEPNTKFGNLQKAGILKSLDEEKYYEQFLSVHEELSKKGYDHYEISNYAQQGFRSIHNSSYWERKRYLGFGPSAHSYLTERRTWNVANNTLYIRSIEKDNIPEEFELLSKKDHLNEYIMTGLRKKEGIDLDYVQKEFETNLMKKNEMQIEELIRDALGTVEKNRLKLTLKGWFQSDEIISRLFID